MYLKNLTLKNFRNYEKLEIELFSGVNFIYGDNGAGKTNIIEAVSVLSGIKSFRNIPDTAIIRTGAESYFCSGLVAEKAENSVSTRKFEVGCSAVSGMQKKNLR